MASGGTSGASFAELTSVMSWVFLNVLGTLFGERAFKAVGALPFVTVMTNLRIGEVLTLMCTLTFWESSFRWGQFFHGWDRWTIALVVVFFGDTWLSGLVVRSLSSVTKGIAKCGTLVSLYALKLFTGGLSFVLPQFLGAAMVVQSSAMFAW